MLMKDIELDELPKYMSPNTLLVDVRLPGDYISNHLEGSINMPYTNTLSMLKSYPKNTPIILYCYNGHYSKMIGNMLLSLGYSNIYNLKNVSMRKSYH